MRALRLCDHAFGVAIPTPAAVWALFSVQSARKNSRHDQWDSQDYPACPVQVLVCFLPRVPAVMEVLAPYDGSARENMVTLTLSLHGLPGALF